jgi:hypothetical protein
MVLQEIGLDTSGSGGGKWRAVGNTAIGLRVLKSAGKFVSRQHDMFQTSQEGLCSVLLVNICSNLTAWSIGFALVIIESGLLSLLGMKAAGWLTEESFFGSRQGLKIFPFTRSRSGLGHIQLPVIPMTTYSQEGGRYLMLTTHRLVLRLRMSGGTLQLPTYLQSLHRDNFTFNFVLS